MSKLARNREANVLLVVEGWELELLHVGTDTTKPREEISGQVAETARREIKQEETKTQKEG